MTKAIIKSVQDLESRLLAGLISKKFFEHQMDLLLNVAKDKSDEDYIRLHKDRDI